MITLDTVRADALGAYGAAPSPTPVLDELTSRGVLVREAMTVTPLTLPAHTSIMTGQYPDVHGVRDNMSFRVDAAAVTLAERLHEAGYATGAFVSAAVLDRAFGLDQGFETYRDTVRGGARRLGVPRRPAEEVVAEAGAWIASQPRERPVFAWVHLYDAHRPYVPPEPYRSMYPGDDGYIASIAYVDAQVGELLEYVRDLGRDPLVVVVADHGEGRGDHGELTHGWFVYRSTMRVPFILAGPGVDAVRLDGPVSVVDVAPTVLELANVPVPEELDGRSLVSELHGDAGPDARVLYGETWSPRFGYGFSELRVVQDRAHRYVQAPNPELFVWSVDPGETNNLVEVQEHQGDLARLRDLVRGRSEREETRSGAAPATRPADPEMVEMLAQLGYVATTPGIGGAARELLPDPKTRPDMIELYDRTMLAARTRPPGEAIPLLVDFIGAFPKVSPARLLLGRAALLAGQLTVGLEALAPLLAGERPEPQAQLLQAQLLLAAGREAEGVAVVRNLEQAWPTWSPPYAVLANHLRGRGHCRAALIEAGAGLERAPDAAELLVVRGACREELGDPARAEVDLRRALDVDPANEDVRFLLGTLLARSGRVAEALPLLEEQARITPDRVEAVAALGLAQYDAGRLEDAVVTLEPIANIEDSGPEVPLVLADALLGTGGDLDRALELLELAERRDHGNVQILAVRARVLAARGDALAAQTTAERYRDMANPVAAP